MTGRAILLIGLLAIALAPAGCRRAEEPLPNNLQGEIEFLQAKKKAMDENLQKIEEARLTLDGELDDMRKSIESIQNALSDIQAQLDALGASPSKASPAKRLPLHISILLVVIAVSCILVILKLRSLQSREFRERPAKGVSSESGREATETRSTP